MAPILVIEQELVLLGLISSTLRLDGHTIIDTSDPIEALSIVERRKQEIDLVLTDAETTPISGFEFVKRLTAKGIDIPVLFISGCPNLAGVIASTLGKSSVIETPFTASALRRSVNRLLALANRNRQSAGSGKSAKDIKRRLVARFPSSIRELFAH